MEKLHKLENDIFEPIRIKGNHTELYVDGPDAMKLLLREIDKKKIK